MKKLCFVSVCFVVCNLLFGWIAPDVKTILDDHKFLYNGGNRVLFFDDGACMVIGVGTAKIKDFERSRKLALQKAEGEIVKAVNAISVESFTHQTSSTRKSKSKVEITNEMISIYKEKVSSNLSNVKIRGYKIDDDIIKVVACRYVQMYAPEYKCNPTAFLTDITAEQMWFDVLASSPEIYLGGIKTIVLDDTLYAIAIASAKPNLRTDVAERIMEMNTSKDFIKYLNSFSLTEEFKIIKSYSHVIENNKNKTNLDEYSKSLSRVNSIATLNNVIKVATFKHNLTGRPSAMYALKLCQLNN